MVGPMYLHENSKSQYFPKDKCKSVQVRINHMWNLYDTLVILIMILIVDVISFIRKHADSRYF